MDYLSAFPGELTVVPRCASAVHGALRKHPTQVPVNSASLKLLLHRSTSLPVYALISAGRTHSSVMDAAGELQGNPVLARFIGTA